MEYDNHLEEFKRDRLFDVYEIETGDYIYSYKTPEPVSDFAVPETHLAGISEESGRLIIWEIEDGW